MAKKVKVVIPSFELTPENLKELKQIKPNDPLTQIKTYKDKLNEYMHNIENITDITIIEKIKLPSIKDYVYDYDNIIYDLNNKNILITKKELKKILSIIN